MPAGFCFVYLFHCELVDLNILDVLQIIIVIFQWPNGASSGWLVRPFVTLILEAIAENRKLSCLGKRHLFYPRPVSAGA